MSSVYQLADEHLVEEIEKLRGVLEVEEAALRLAVAALVEDARAKGRLLVRDLPGCPDLDASELEWTDYFITRGAAALASRGLAA